MASTAGVASGVAITSPIRTRNASPRSSSTSARRPLDGSAAPRIQRERISRDFAAVAHAGPMHNPAVAIRSTVRLGVALLCAAGIVASLVARDSRATREQAFQTYVETRDVPRTLQLLD